MVAHRINHYFDSSEELLPIAREARNVKQLQQIYSRVAPAALVQASRIKHLRAGVLCIIADNAAVATKLQQQASRLLSACQKQRVEVTAIRFEVQVANTAGKVGTNSAYRRLSIETIANL